MNFPFSKAEAEQLLRRWEGPWRGPGVLSRWLWVKSLVGLSFCVNFLFWKDFKLTEELPAQYTIVNILTHLPYHSLFLSLYFFFFLVPSCRHSTPLSLILQGLSCMVTFKVGHEVISSKSLSDHCGYCPRCQAAFFGKRDPQFWSRERQPSGHEWPLLALSWGKAEFWLVSLGRLCGQLAGSLFIQQLLTEPRVWPAVLWKLCQERPRPPPRGLRHE